MQHSARYLLLRLHFMRAVWLAFVFSSTIGLYLNKNLPNKHILSFIVVSLQSQSCPLFVFIDYE